MTSYVHSPCKRGCSGNDNWQGDVDEGGVEMLESKGEIAWREAHPGECDHAIIYGVIEGLTAAILL